MTKPRIVIMANNIDEVGGAQRVVHVVAQHLGLRGYPVDLVGVTPFEPRHEFVTEPSFRRFTLMPEPWPAPPALKGLRGSLDPATRRTVAARRALRAAAVKRLGEVLADGPLGVVVTAQLWAMEHLDDVAHDGWAVVGQYHSSFEAAAAGRDLPRALDLYSDVDLFTLLTPDDADAFRGLGLNNTSWLANPLAFWPEQPAPMRGGDACVVTFLGRLSPEKGVGFLIEAWGRIADHHPDWRLQVVGSGPDEKTVRAAARTLRAGGDRIDFLPPTQDAESVLRGSDIVVLPSLTEGLPLVLAEAMSLGLPCVATDCSAGVRLLTGDGSDAQLVARADAEALGGAMSRLMSDPTARTALGSRARVAMEPYRADVIIDQWERMIADVLR